MNILVFGHVCIDHNISENISYTGAGGSAFFISHTLNKLPGCSTTVVAPYGPDFLPYLKEMTILPPQPNEKVTLVYENVSRFEKRTQKALHREQAEPVSLDKEIISNIEAADIIFLAPLLPNFQPSYIQKIFHSTRKNTFTVFLPQGFYRDFDEKNNVIKREFVESDQILPYVDVVIASEHDHPKMRETMQTWAQKFNLIGVVTLGSRGASAITKDKEIPLPTQPVAENEVINSVGSGDIFSAGFAYKYFETKDIEAAGKFANRLAREGLVKNSFN